MSFRAVALSVVRTTALSVLALLLLTSALIQVKNRSIRLQDERLLADFHSIRLNQTTWPEAQAIMQRWGSLGHAHGPCTSTDCAYDITVLGWPSLLPNGTAAPWLYHCCGRFPLLLQFVGIRFSALELRLLLEDGAVRRAYLSLTAETQDASGVSLLLVTVRSSSSLDQALNDVGADEELGIHPDFIVGPNGFCTGCEEISLVYTPHIAPAELMRLTSFNLSCFTRMLPCLHLSTLAPALMREDAANLQNVPRNSVRCTTPAWALGRDAGAIWLVDTLATRQVPDPYPDDRKMPAVVEEDQIRVVRILKGPLRIPPQTTLRFRPYSGVEYEARAVPEHLTKGHRYILMPSIEGNWLEDGAQAWRCGVIEDTPANELSVEQGISMDDHLRAPELTGAWPW